MKLSDESVDKIMMDVLFDKDEDTSSQIKVNMPNCSFGFHPDRLEANRENIINLCDQLPKEFKEIGGRSLLCAIVDEDGKSRWGDTSRAVALVALGIAVGKVALTVTEDLWKYLPREMPFYQVIDGDTPVIQCSNAEELDKHMMRFARDINLNSNGKN